MKSQFKIGAVSYLNAEPLVWPLEQGVIKHNHTIIRALPRDLADKIVTGELDCALAPVTVLLDNPRLVPIPEVAIACRGAVASVLVLHNDPFETLTTIWLDPASRTSNLLVQVLRKTVSEEPCKYIFPEGEDVPPLSAIPPRTGVLIIGDRALTFLWKHQRQAGFTDLGELWKERTNLPFTFAMWIAKDGDTGASLAPLMREARDWSLLHLNEMLDPLAARYGFEASHIDQYFRRNVTYLFGPREQEGLKRFFEMVEGLKLER